MSVRILYLALSDISMLIFRLIMVRLLFCFSLQVMLLKFCGESMVEYWPNLSKYSSLTIYTLSLKFPFSDDVRDYVENLIFV